MQDDSGYPLSLDPLTQTSRSAETLALTTQKLVAIADQAEGLQRAPNQPCPIRSSFCDLKLILIGSCCLANELYRKKECIYTISEKVVSSNANK